jgi:hypothetical protein
MSVDLGRSLGAGVGVFVGLSVGFGDDSGNIVDLEAVI